MLRAQLISQQNTRTVDIKTLSQCITIVNKKLHKNRIYRNYPIFSNENIRHPIISMIYIGNIYQANPAH